MIKFLSQLVGAKVMLYQERAIVGEVLKVLIDPNDGSIVGLSIAPVHQKEIAYIPMSEIKGYGQGFLLVEGLSSLSEEEDVIKIKKILGKEANIIGAKVATESGQSLGKVEDATLDLKNSSLNKIYVAPSFPLGIFGSQKIIGLSQIIKIDKKRIIVKDTTMKNKKSILAVAKLPTTD